MAIGAKLFKYRWLIALAIFAVCVLLRISGSSIGAYDQVFPTQIVPQENTLLGTVRNIRSDEYGVQTPTFFSQAYNDYELFSNRKSVADMNMVVDYYSPVLDATALGKPLMWGYILFGNEVGLSWYWCGLIILIFMTALETTLILTKGSKLLSLMGGTMITLAPAIQWWVLPHMPIVIMYAMALFSIGYYFFTAEGVLRRWVFSGLAAIAALGFALSIFPSFQVPCIYVVIALLVACLWRDSDRISFCKKQWFLIALPVIITAGILVYFVLVSKDDLYALLNTTYPGDRLNTTSGNTWRELFTDLTSVFLPYKDVTYSNNCEVSTFIQFAPFFMLLMPRIVIYLKNAKSRDSAVGISMAVLLIVFAIYMCIGVPKVIAEITMLRYCNRMKGVYGWLATLFTIWGISILTTHPNILKKPQKITYPIIFGVVSLLTLDENQRGFFETLIGTDNSTIGRALILAEIAVIVIILIAISFSEKKFACGCIAAVMLVAGATVNPVEIGTGAVYNHPISAAISEISEKDTDACWLSVDCAFFLSNFLAANGARVIDATNFYPDEEKWDIIDPQGKYRDCTNRYANQTCTLCDENENSIVLNTPDSITINLTPDTLKKLKIKYMFTSTDNSALLTKYGISSTAIAGQDGYTIYELSY